MKALAPVAVLLLSAAMLMAKPGWSTDYAASLAKAKAENKMVLLDFTGSDWCPACIQIDNEIFAQPEFRSYAKDNLELVELDFPYGKTVPPRIKAQNEMLREKYNIKGFPTIIVLNSNGKKIAETAGYMPGSSVFDFIAELKKLKNK